MDRATVMMAMAAMADPKANAADVARRLNITTTTLYVYVNGDNLEASWAGTICVRYAAGQSQEFKELVAVS